MALELELAAPVILSSHESLPLPEPPSKRERTFFQKFAARPLLGQSGGLVAQLGDGGLAKKETSGAMLPSDP